MLEEQDRHSNVADSQNPLAMHDHRANRTQRALRTTLLAPRIHAGEGSPAYRTPLLMLRSRTTRSRTTRGRTTRGRTTRRSRTTRRRSRSSRMMKGLAQTPGLLSFLPLLPLLLDIAVVPVLRGGPERAVFPQRIFGPSVGFDDVHEHLGRHVLLVVHGAAQGSHRGGRGNGVHVQVADAWGRDGQSKLVDKRRGKVMLARTGIHEGVVRESEIFHSQLFRFGRQVSEVLLVFGMGYSVVDVMKDALRCFVVPILPTKELLECLFRFLGPVIGRENDTIIYCTKSQRRKQEPRWDR